MNNDELEHIWYILTEIGNNVEELNEYGPEVRRLISEGDDDAFDVVERIRDIIADIKDVYRV